MKFRANEPPTATPDELPPPPTTTLTSRARSLAITFTSPWAADTSALLMLAETSLWMSFRPKDAATATPLPVLTASAPLPE